MSKLMKKIKAWRAAHPSKKAYRNRVEELELQVSVLEARLKAMSKAQQSKPKAEKPAEEGRSVTTLEQQAKLRRAEEKEGFIQTVMKKTGWDHAYAAAQMSEAKKQVGISYKNYVKHAFYLVPPEEQKEKYAAIKADTKEEKAAKKAKKNEAYLKTVMDATGWDKEYAQEKIKQANKENGVSYEHYAIYRFWELTPEEQKTYFSKGDADRLRDIYNTNSSILKIFMNKDLFCKNFDEYLGRPWCTTDQMTLHVFKEKFASVGKVIYKPLSSSGGRGIEVFSFDDSTAENVYAQIRSMPKGIVEGYVVQHPEMKKLSLNSVNTVRIVTIQTFDDIPGVEKGKVHFVYGGVRMGNGSSVVDNLHQGGMIACIDINTGVIETDAVDFANRVYERHPDTNVQIKGFQVPYFQEAKQLIEKACAGIPGYLGWDIAITETGPIIIELNTHPGADGLQTPFIPQKEGKRYVVEKFLYDPKKPNRIPDTPYGTKISGIMKEGIEFYWKKLEIADGYEIYRGYSEIGPFEKIALIEKRSIGTYIDADFDHSKKHVFYTLRSFVKQDDGSLSYSQMIAPKKASFREELTVERPLTCMYSGTTRSIRAFWGWGEPEDLCWSSENEAIATVSRDGIITAVSSGSCLLTCTSEKIGQTATAQVTVDRQACEPLGPVVSRYSQNPHNGHWENAGAEATNDAVIMLVGDMMCGKKQMQTQCTPEQGWNFNDSYDFVKEITAEADFAAGNLETLLAAGWPYMLDESYIDNMNNCNATSRYLDAVRYGGFDAVVMANNHNCDGGTRALLETIDQVEKYRLAHTGVFRDAAEQRFFIANINGIKVGFLSYICQETGFNNKDAGWSREDKDALLNIFSPEKAQKDIAACREAGAEYVIVYMHWGFKNFRNVVQHQVNGAQAVAEAGADYIIGSNPHMVQRYELLTTGDGRSVPCVFSVGNFQSVMNQIVGNRDCVIMRLRLTRAADGHIVLAENNYIPCYTYTTCGNSRWAPVAVSQQFNPSAKKKNRKSTYDRIVSAMGDGIRQL